MINVKNTNSYASLESQNSRRVLLPKLMEIAGVESDENVRSIKFKFPKIVDGVDLTEMQLKINFMNGRQEKGQYIVTDLTPHPSDENYVTFSWNLSRLVTRYRGVTKFIVCAVKTDEDGKIVTEWNTSLSQMQVLEGLEVEEPEISPEEKDVIAQLITLSQNSADNAEQSAQQAADSAKKAEEQLGKIVTPHIGENGNWYIGETDTGKPSSGQGAPGTDGKTPVRGVDYWTNEDKVQVIALAAAGALSEAASPVFISRLEDMTDTEKVYVFNGFIYAYQYVESTTIPYTNLFNASDSDFRDKVRLDGSGNPVDGNGFLSGFIAATPSDTIRVHGDSADYTGWPQAIIGLYTADKTPNGSCRVYLETANMGTLTVDEDKKGFTYVPMAGTAYVRIAGAPYSHYSDFIITKNEEIKPPVTEGEYKWVNTGYAYSPADYQDVIARLQLRVDNLESIANNPEASQEIPAYVHEEAEKTSEKVLGHRNGKSLVFLAMSDMHIPLNANTYTSVKHAGMGAKLIRDITEIDCAAILGDYLRGASDSTAAEGKSAYKYAHQHLANACYGIPSIWLQGNHDMQLQSADGANRFTPIQMQAYIGGQNRKAITPDGLYGYVDFEQQKIRMVFLNTSDSNTSKVYISPEQAKYIADTALNLSDKPDFAQWGVIVVSHVPLTYSAHADLYAVKTMCEAFAAGSSGNVTVNGTQIDYNFAEHGELIAFFHGHTHNFLHKQYNGFWHIGVPNVCAGRENEYASYTDGYKTWGEFEENGTTPKNYSKKAGSGTDTSFNVITIDRANKKIYCDNYGAGYDREISY